MSINSKIEWTDATWNPWHGCHKVSAGCKNCYMFRDKIRFGQDPTTVKRASDKTFYAPLNWKEPRRIFTCSWSDFFIEEADEWRDEAFTIIALTPQHTYQVLTKRPDRMLEQISKSEISLIDHSLRLIDTIPEGQCTIFNEAGGFQWPLPNVWLGVSVEDQKAANERIPILVQTPAAVRFLSIEPLLAPVDLSAFMGVTTNITGEREQRYSFLDWVIVGGESGPDARPMDPDWVRSIRDQCQAAGVPLFFKQGSQANWPSFKNFGARPAEFQIRDFPSVATTRISS